MWEPYLVEDEPLPATFDGRLSLLRKGVRHVLTHRILMTDFYLLECDKKPALPPDYQWVAESDIDHYGVPRLVEMLFDLVGRS